MNTVIIVNAYITNAQSEEMFYNHLLQLKKFNLPIMVSANVLSSRIQNVVDHFFISGENLLFKKDYKNYNFASHYIHFQNFYIESRQLYKSPHGLSVLSFRYKNASIANMLGYEYSIVVEWDCFFDDDDIENLKKYHNELIKDKNKNALIFTVTHDLRPMVCVHIPMFFKNKFFLENFPKILCEEDYELFFKKSGSNKFLIDEEILNICLIKNNKNSIIEYNVEEFKYASVNTILNKNTHSTNWPLPSTSTTRKLFCKSDVPNKFWIVSFNKNYINPTNPNFETIDYKITTQSDSFNITHIVNNDQWQMTNPIEITSREFPIKISTDGCEIIYNSVDEIPNKINFY